MNIKTRKYYLLNLIFVTGLIILFINDHYFKLEYSNWLTGKLSDFVGVLILPMVITYFFPKSIKQNVLLAGLLFIFWKSPFSQPLIDGYNQITFIKITRVVDFTDLLALVCLPISYFALKNLNHSNTLKIQGIHPIVLLIPTMIIFMATSPPAYYRYTYSKGELKCYKCTKTVNYSKSELLEILEKNNIKATLDTLPSRDGYRFDSYWKDSTNNLISDYPYYKIDTIIIEQDTITNFQFALENISDDKTKIWINGMNIPEEIPNNKVERKLRKYYRRLIKNHIQQWL